MFCILIRISSHTHKDFVLTTNLQYYVYNIRYDWQEKRKLEQQLQDLEKQLLKKKIESTELELQQLAQAPISPQKVSPRHRLHNNLLLLSLWSTITKTFPHTLVALHVFHLSHS